TVERDTGRVLGSTRYLSLRPEHRGVEIRNTWLAPAAWSSGANVEAKLLMLGQAFDHAGCDARRVQDGRAQHRVPPRARGAACELRGHLPQAHADPRRDSRFRLLRDRRRRLAAGEGEPRAAAEGEVLEDEREVAEILDGELQAAARRDDEETALRRRGDGEDQTPLADPEADRVPRCLAPW